MKLIKYLAFLVLVIPVLVLTACSYNHKYYDEDMGSKLYGSENNHYSNEDYKYCDIGTYYTSYEPEYNANDCYEGEEEEDDVGSDGYEKDEMEDLARITGIVINRTNYLLVVGSSVVLIATIIGEGDFDNSITWQSDNQSVVTVNGGIISTHSSGIATIIATSTNPEFFITASIHVVAEPNNLVATFGDTLSTVNLPIGWSWQHPSNSANALVGSAGQNQFYATYNRSGWNPIAHLLNVTVNKATPNVNTPTGIVMTYSQTLKHALLPVRWSWNDSIETPVGSVGLNHFFATYAPTNTANWNTITRPVLVKVNRATPQPEMPTGLEAIFGQTLQDVILPDGWTWNNATTTVGSGVVGGAVGNRNFLATYTRNANWYTISRTLTVYVHRATPTPAIPTGVTAVEGFTLSAISLPRNWSWNVPSTSVGLAGLNTFYATYNAGNNWNNVVKPITVTVEEMPTFTKVVTGEHLLTTGVHTLAIDENGSIWGWGANNRGQIGDGSTTNRNMPVRVIDGNFTYVAVGGQHSLALDKDGRLWSWGGNSLGQLGTGNNVVDRHIPDIMVRWRTFKSISAGNNHSVAVCTEGGLFAWGLGMHPQIGSNAIVVSPVRVPNTDTTFVTVSAGRSHKIALDIDGNIWVMQHRDFTIAFSQLNLSNQFTTISARGNQNFATDTEGNMWSWENNIANQLPVLLA